MKTPWVLGRLANGDRAMGLRVMRAWLLFRVTLGCRIVYALLETEAYGFV
jgi:hypothetical protein